MEQLFPTMASIFSATLSSMDSPSLHPEETESVDIVPAVSLRSLVVVALGGLVLCNNLKWGNCLKLVPSTLCVVCLFVSGFNNLLLRMLQ